MNAIRNVEIFAAGQWNGDTYTERDLDDMVSAFRELDYRPALKLGHTKDAPGAPAYGWIENLRRVGRKLVADFVDMHDSVVNAIRKRAYSRVSSEIYFNLKRGGKTFARALKAVALLGAEVPAVANLVPLHKMEFADWTFEAHAYVRPFNVEGDYDDSPGAVVDRAAKRYQREHPEATYEQALKAAFDPSLPQHRAYAAGASPMGDSETPEQMDAQRMRAALGGTDPRERYDAGVVIHKLMIAEMDDHPTITQSEALKRVLLKYPVLAEKYRAGHGGVSANWDAVIGA